MRRHWILTLAAVGAVLLAAGGYEVGVQTHGSAAPSCAASRHAAESLVDEWTKQELHEDDARRLLTARAAADAILQNPHCFTPEVDARARAAAQQLGQSGTTDDVRLAAGEFVCEALGRSPYDCQA
ncbi:hypothetical protein ACTAF0_32065 [Streptomyces murinus]|uniref:hypothetical protein n=1 Tax=Streptomyces murinus TaxID=33900 RepID=UPI002E81770B|nr:hypothetical protein [Streptomyces murinus]WUD06018.1 hypothetical protein OG586_07170 [Streptomyces murinus]